MNIKLTQTLSQTLPNSKPFIFNLSVKPNQIAYLDLLVIEGELQIDDTANTIIFSLNFTDKLELRSRRHDPHHMRIIILTNNFNNLEMEMQFCVCV